jgi:1-acyl-sn-glycerol-3-phosphate acyltransferase
MIATLIHYRRRVFLLRLARRLGGAKLLLGLARRFYRLQVEGIEHVPPQGACLLTFNHVAHITDALVYLVLRQRRPDVHLLTWRLVQDEIAGLMAAAALDENGPQLLFAHKRQGLSVADLLRARQVLLNGGAVALAPEGEPTWDGRLQRPLAPGAAWMALRTACPVTPIVSIGGYDIQPVWQPETIRLTGRVTIRVGQPFTLCDAPLDSVEQAALDEASQRIWDALAALLPDDKR